MNKRFHPVRFPRDHQAHDTIIEWWYFNGHVKDKKGKRYGFMDCLFKVDVRRVNVSFLNKLPFKGFIPSWPYVYFSHSVVSDVSRQKNEKSVQNISLVSRDSFLRERLFVNYIDPLIFRGYVNSEIAETDQSRFHVKGDLLDLDLVSRKKPLLVGGKGLVTVASGKSTYYYSLTDLRAQGSLMIGGKRMEVEGGAWMDHQWADTPYSKDAWTWFGIRLDNGADIMCVEYDDRASKTSCADIIDKRGRAVHGRRVAFTPGTDTWKSAKTKAEYPLSWIIDIPEERISIKVRSLMTDQEMIYGAINYWEGPVDVEGVMGRKKVKGEGYMELVGYPSDYNYLILAGKELNAKLRGMISARLHGKLVARSS
jgi:predicted secreted hydrolase